MTIQLDPKYAAKLSKGKSTIKQLDPLMVVCPKTGTCYPVTGVAEADFKVGDELVFATTGELLTHATKTKPKARSSGSSTGMTMHTATMPKGKWLNW